MLVAEVISFLFSFDLVVDVSEIRICFFADETSGAEDDIN